MTGYEWKCACGWRGPKPTVPTPSGGLACEDCGATGGLVMKELVPERFIDEAGEEGAAPVGWAWITALAKSCKAEVSVNLEDDRFTRDGGCTRLWVNGYLRAYYVIFRDQMNYSVLIRHDLSEYYNEKVAQSIVRRSSERSEEEFPGS